MFRMTVAALAVALTSSVAHAALSVADLSQSGDGLLTVDSVSGLAWLDIGATRGMSVADVIASGDWLSKGFRFAKASELDQLVQQGAQQLDFMAWMGAWGASSEVNAYLGGPTTLLAGVLAGDGAGPDGSMRADTLMLTRDTRITPGEPTGLPKELEGEWIDVSALRSPVQGPVINRDDLLGFFDQPSGGWVGEPAEGDALLAPLDASFGDFLRRRTQSVSPLDASLARGVFLVKNVSPVPEPESMALMGIGLVGVLSVARRRRIN